jgi:hypothetical protein
MSSPTPEHDAAALRPRLEFAVGAAREAMRPVLAVPSLLYASSQSGELPGEHESAATFLMKPSFAPGAKPRPVVSIGGVW